MKRQSSEGEMATMTTMFNSLHYHIISRCSTYNSRAPPLPAGPLMFALRFGSRRCCKSTHYCAIHCCYCCWVWQLEMNSVVVTTADALWLLLPAIWQLTAVCWALTATHLIIKLDFTVIHHFITSILLASAPTGRQLSVCGVVIRCSLHTTLFSLRKAAVLDCQTHRRQNNSQNAWNVPIYPSLSGVVEGSRHKQSAVSRVASRRRTVASFLTPTVTAAQREGRTSTTCPSSWLDHRIKRVEELELTAFCFRVHLSCR